MFRGPGRSRQRILSIAQKFKEKGATSPDKAMTSQDLGLESRFDGAMKRRLGHTEIFVDVGGGRYYLNEGRLDEFQNGPEAIGMHRRRTSLIIFRIIGLALGAFILAFAIINFFYERSILLWLAILGLLILWLLATVLQFRLQVSARGRKMMRQSSTTTSNLNNINLLQKG